MKRTLLDLTQSVLSSMGADEINSISDTAESVQVAEIIKTAYLNMLSRYNLPEHNQLFQLTASGDADLPVIMYIPEGIDRINWIQYYNSDTDDTTFTDIKVMNIKDFVDKVNMLDPTATNVDTFVFSLNNQATAEPSPFTIRFETDRQPKSCTIVQNYYVIFDAYDEALDGTLQSSKTRCLGSMVPAFTLADTFIPNLDDRTFPLLLNEAKALAFLELKQMPHPKAEQEARRQISSLQKFKNVSTKPSDFDELPNFGRHGRKW